MADRQLARQHGERGRRRRTGPRPAERGQPTGPPASLSTSRPVTRRLVPAYAALVALIVLIVAGRAGVHQRFYEFLNFGAGVVALVSLTSAVLWGLAATDRLILGPGHRLLAQGVHRGMAILGITALFVHVVVKVNEAQTGAVAAVVPFSDAARPLEVGLGTLAGYMFIAVAVTGAVRSSFNSRSRSRLWRALHMGAYVAWGSALVHGLKAGRAADGWVTGGYALAVVGVAVALLLRLRARRNIGPRFAAEPPPASAGSGPRRGPEPVPETVVQLPVGGARRSDGGVRAAGPRGWAS